MDNPAGEAPLTLNERRDRFSRLTHEELLQMCMAYDLTFHMLIQDLKKMRVLVEGWHRQLNRITDDRHSS
jgi:hypothetical protein